MAFYPASSMGGGSKSSISVTSSYGNITITQSCGVKIFSIVQSSSSTAILPTATWKEIGEITDSEYLPLTDVTDTKKVVDGSNWQVKIKTTGKIEVYNYDSTGGKSLVMVLPYI